QGIGKHLANQARVLSTPSDEDFEKTVADVHDKVARAVRNFVRELEINQERERAKTRIEDSESIGGTVADLIRLAKSDKRFGAILADPPWGFQCWSGPEKRVVSRITVAPYDTMETADIAALPVADLARPDCVLFLWMVWPTLPQALDIIRAWGFEYKTCGFAWTKADPSIEDDVYMGLGY